MTDTELTNNVEEALQDLTAALLGNNNATIDAEIHNSRISNSDIVSRNSVMIEGSENITVLESSQRFSSAIWYEKIHAQNILVAGCGGIGSYVVFLLSRMKPAHITIYDPDTIEYVNLAGQLFGIEHVGRLKVSAVSAFANDYSDYYQITSMPVAFTEQCEPQNIMICGFDNMSARKTFFNKWKEYVGSLSEEERRESLFIDGRLAAEEFQVLCLTGDNQFAIDKYESSWLFDDSEAEATVCSYKQTAFAATMIGSVIANLFVNFCANLCNPLIERDVPFLTRYDATTMFFKAE